VRVVLEPVEEPRLSSEQQHALWQAWIEHGPQGPIETDPIPTCREASIASNLTS